MNYNTAHLHDAPVAKAIGPAPLIRVTVRPSTERWAYPDLATDWHNATEALKGGDFWESWRIVEESFADDALECLPPIYISGGFMVGEPYTTGPDGREVFAAFVTHAGKNYARYASRADIGPAFARLRKHLGLSAPVEAGK